MAAAEFDLIDRYFACHKPGNSDNVLGIGDDCALLNVPPDQQLAVTTDSMVAGVHFFADVDPEALGHKLLAVNLSDLAAMGAQPLAVTLALTLPAIEHDWLEAFCRGFLSLAKHYQVDLIGGDTTAGPLTLTVQAMGLVPRGQALLRSTAQVGDLIYVSGAIGSAGLGLKIRAGAYPHSDPDAIAALERPMPQLALGQALRGVAHACVDISDGLASDLGHILQQSSVGATIDASQLPLSSAVQVYIATTGDWTLPLLAGDDYQLCFTVPPHQKHRVPGACVCIGQIEAQPGLRVWRHGQSRLFEGKGFEHFA